MVIEELLSDSVLGLLQTGAVGTMLVMTWRLMKSKDEKIYDTIEKQNDERRAMYQSMAELVREASTAIADKNSTDRKMAHVIEKLTYQIIDLKHIVDMYTKECGNKNCDCKKQEED